MRVRVAVVASLAIGLLAACTAPNPIDVSNPVDYQTQPRVFTIQVPSAWARGQDNTDTETVALMNDPTRTVGMFAYAGLLERRFTDEEGWSAVTGLAQTLVGRPAGFQATDQKRTPDGTFDLSFSFPAGDHTINGHGTFRDADLALSGVILTAPADVWDSVQAAMKPFVDSFKLDADAVKGTFFVPLQEPGYALAVPNGWEQQRRVQSMRVTARNRKMSMIVIQVDADQPLDQAQLADQTAQSLRVTFGLRAAVSSAEAQPDGRLKVTMAAGDRTVIGYVEQKDNQILGLVFDVPADRVADYQPFIDFEVFTFVTNF